jgi:hypothetical protein
MYRSSRDLTLEQNLYILYRDIQYGKFYSRVCFSATNLFLTFIFVEIFVTVFSSLRLNEQLNNFDMVFQSELTKKLQDVSRRLEETSSKLYHFLKKVLTRMICETFVPTKL